MNAVSKPRGSQGGGKQTNHGEASVSEVALGRTSQPPGSQGGGVQIKDGEHVAARIPLPLEHGRRRGGAQMSFTDTYGYRGSDPRLCYLSPWEFTKWWRREPLKQPDWYTQHGKTPKTEWTESGKSIQAAFG